MFLLLCLLYFILLFLFTAAVRSFFFIHWYSDGLAQGGNLLKNVEGGVTSQLRQRWHPRGLVCLDSRPQS